MRDDSTTDRILRLLGLLQSRRRWQGADLAARLDVSGRTLRRDIERLRRLGYHIGGERGSDGGYALEAGADLPPLVLSDAEVVVVAVALRTATAGAGVSGIDELALTALAKLELLIPARLRRRVAALHGATAVLPRPDSGVDPEILAALALASRDAERVALRYPDAEGGDSRRRIEPHALVARRRRWYLLAWDLDREDWRTFRVDRVVRVDPTGVRFEPRAIPGGDAAAFLEDRFSVVDQAVAATIEIEAPLETVVAHLGGYARDLEAQGDRTRWRIEDSSLEVLASALVWLPWRFAITDSPELRRLVGEVGARFNAASSGP